LSKDRSRPRQQKAGENNHSTSKHANYSFFG
jgi:hypothetical protein